MHYKTCEICGTKAGRVGDQKRTFMAKFPLDEDRCKRWVQVTGKEDLAHVPIEKLHELKYICGKHFLLRDFKKKMTQLKRNAIPSVLITAKPLPDEILMGFPLHIFANKYQNTHQRHSDHSYFKEELSVTVLWFAGIKLHSFPNPTNHNPLEIERFRTWVMKIGGNIVGKADNIIYNNARVCSRHFERIYIYPNGRLNRRAIPTLYLPFLGNSTDTHIATLEKVENDIDHTYIKKKPLSFTAVLQDSAQIVNFDHIYVRKRIHVDHTYTKDQDAEGDEDWDRTFAAISGKATSLSTLENIETHTDHSYTKSAEKKENTLQSSAGAQTAKKEENKLVSNLKEDGGEIQIDTFENDDLPPSPEEELTTEIVSEIGDSITIEKCKGDNIFSWQRTELIEADDHEDPKSAAVPEQPKIPEDLTLSLFCEPEPPPLPPKPSEIVAVVPEDAELKCKDCSAVIDGFSWWCVHCCCGARCGVCAGRAQHDAHYVLRAPPTATYNQTQAALAVIREQLLKGNLLSLYGTDDDGVKVEIKPEPEERPPSPTLSAALPDPLAIDFFSDEDDSQTDPFSVEPHADQFIQEADPEPLNVYLEEEPIDHHPFKRPRLVDYLTAKTNSTVTTQDILQRSLLKIPRKNLKESVQTPSVPKKSQDVILAKTNDSSGSQTVPNVTASDPSGSQTLTPITHSDLKKLHTFLLTAASDPGTSQDMLNAITSDLKGIETILKRIPSDPSEAQTAVQLTSSDPTGSETVLQVDPSDVSRSHSVIRIDSSDLKQSQDVLITHPTGSQTVLQADPSNLKELQTTLQDVPTEAVLQLDINNLNEVQDVLLAISSDSTESQTVWKIDPSDLIKLQDVLQDTTSDLLTSETIQQVDPSNRNELQTTLLDDPTGHLGSPTVLQINPSDLRMLPDAPLTTDSTILTRSRSLLNVAPKNGSGLRSLLKFIPSDRIGSLRSLLNVAPKDGTGSQSLLKVTPTNRIGSRALPNTIARSRGVSQTLRKVIPSHPHKIQLGKPMMSRTLHQVNPSNSESKTRHKSLPSILRKSQTVLKLDKIQNVPKGAPLISLRQNDPEVSTCELPQNIPRGKSIPVKVTSELKPTETVIVNLDGEVDAEDVEFLEEDILDFDNEEAIEKEVEQADEELVTNIENEVDDILGKKLDKYRKLTHRNNEEEMLDTNRENRLDEDVEHGKDLVTNVGSELDEDIGKIIYEKYRKLLENHKGSSSSNSRQSEVDVGDQVDKETRTDADSVRDYEESDIDDSDLDKDYRVEKDNIEEDSMDETDVEDIVGRGVGRITRNATKTPEKGPSDAILRMLTSKAVVKLEPLTSSDIQKWTASRKRPRKD